MKNNLVLGISLSALVLLALFGIGLAVEKHRSETQLQTEMDAISAAYISPAEAGQVLDLYRPPSWSEFCRDLFLDPTRTLATHWAAYTGSLSFDQYSRVYADACRERGY